MKLVRLFALISVAALAPAAMAQHWEFGVGAGAGLYTSQDVKLGSNSAAAKLKTNLVGSAWVGNDINERWGGELRYSYQFGALQLKRDAAEATFGAETHTVNYNFLWHTRTSEAAIRPFVSGGAGIKFFRGTGAESVTQPLSQYALLTQANDLKPVVSAGVGVKVRLGAHTWLRLDVHDYASPFPKEVITPNVGAEVGGWLHDIVPMVAISFGN